MVRTYDAGDPRADKPLTKAEREAEEEADRKRDEKKNGGFSGGGFSGSDDDPATATYPDT